jgi:hypothetical protein
MILVIYNYYNYRIIKINFIWWFIMKNIVLSTLVATSLFAECSNEQIFEMMEQGLEKDKIEKICNINKKSTNKKQVKQET